MNLKDFHVESGPRISDAEGGSIIVHINLSFPFHVLSDSYDIHVRVIPYSILVKRILSISIIEC